MINCIFCLIKHHILHLLQLLINKTGVFHIIKKILFFCELSVDEEFIHEEFIHVIRKGTTISSLFSTLISLTACAASLTKFLI